MGRIYELKQLYYIYNYDYINYYYLKTKDKLILNTLLNLYGALLFIFREIDFN